MLPFRVISQRSVIAMHCKSFISICFRDLSLACYLSVRRPWHTALRPSFIINTLQEYRHSKGLCFLINIHMLVCIVFPFQLFLFLSLFLYQASQSYFLPDSLYFSEFGLKALYFMMSIFGKSLKRRIFLIMTSYCDGLKCCTFSIQSNMSNLCRNSDCTAFQHQTNISLSSQLSQEFKGTSSPKNGNSVIIYSPLCCSKPVWLFFCFCG